jgi:glycosyltransferase involved in cell wall biosynthesis
MIFLAWFIFAFTVVQFLIALANLVSLPKLPSRKLNENPLVSILIPARNEEKNIGNILNDIINQEYKEIEVIVFNDLSTDKTPEIVRDFAERYNRIRLINSELLPEGWLGKNWACHSLSMSAKGDYLLFLDADVRIGNGIINNAISYAKRSGFALISIFPKQIFKTTGEKITVPNMNYILLSLLPLILVRISGMSSLAAANGQFMFFDSKIYKSLHPHEKMKNNKVEDIEIARFLKKEKYRIACLVGDGAIQCRMYSSFKEAVNGFSKNVRTFFGNSLILSLLFWFITTFGFIIVLTELPMIYFVWYLIAYILSRVIISVVSEQNVLENLLFLIPQQISCGLFIYYSILNKNLKAYKWKGRDLR